MNKTKTYLSESQFSPRYLLTFGAAFATICGLIIWNSFAATVTTTCANLGSTVAAAAPGTVVQLQGGECNFQVNLSNISKDAANPVQITAANPNNPPIIRGSTQAGYPGLFVLNSSGLTIGPGLVFSNPNGTGVQVNTSSNVTLKGNKFIDNAGQGIIVQAPEGATNNNVDIIANEFSGNGTNTALDPHPEKGTGLHSIYYGGGYGITYGGKVVNNWVHDSKNGTAIQIGPAARNSVFAFNTIQRIPVNGASVDRLNCFGPFSDLQKSSGLQVWSNICQDVPGHAVQASMWTAQPPIVHNENNVTDRIGLVGFPTTYGSYTTMTVGTNFDETLGNLKLAATGQPIPATDSPLVGRASSNHIPTTDFNGNPRTLRTIGAFEPNSSTPPPPSPVFTTSLNQNMTINLPYIWTFNPGEPTIRGQFWADGTLLHTVEGSGPYSYILQVGMLSGGSHQLGHGWDTTSGVHKTPPAVYTVNINSTKPGDLNGDNQVNVLDMSILLSNYNTTNTIADINKDGIVNITDLSILLTNYGT